MRSATILLAALVLSACSASMIDTRKRVIGPTPEVGVIDAGGGQIKYSGKGLDAVVRARRRDAFAQMAAYCGGKDRFHIVDEVERHEAGASYQRDREDLEDSVKMGKHYQFEKFHHLFFECVK